MSVTLPHLRVLTCFVHGEKGQLTLCGNNEACFRTWPLASLTVASALLNTV